MLTSYNGITITYDEIGNPLTYGNGYKNYTFTWTGKNLTSLTTGGVTYSFTYNDQGFRTSKTKDGVTTNYYYEGSRLIVEETQGNIKIYLYNSEGFPLGMQYHGASYAEDVWDVYWYETNLQGDVVGIYDQTGVKLASCSYDAWGLRTVTLHNGATWSVITKNPLGYRGYYYDSELGFYCLGTRYYDQNTHRFISPDNVDVVGATPTALMDKNLYAYCDNNPIMRRDDGGQFWDTVFDVISLVGSVVDVCMNPSDPWAWVGLAGDVVDLIPFVSCVGEAADIARVASKADKMVDAVDDVYDAAKAMKKGVAAAGASAITKTDVFDGAIDTYKDLRKVSKGSGNEVHHIIEKRFRRDVPELGPASQMGSIVLDKQTHRQFTNAWQKALPYGGHYSKMDILNAGMEIYKEYPSLQRYIFDILS